ncbi:MAG: hypothetical protein GF375_06805 [Candidatus Omnitrophica bacterium]|nr:hypothetical protein [Candidatus Omnitrophota bacterium]MBD3269685.1 hypothetical protein [Candidatus Omnitrophota bacterium]
MKYAIFSDIHANLPAFRTAVEFYKKEDIDIFIFNGDIVGYGADPNPCTELLKELNPVNLAGNHDWAVLEKIGIEFFNPYAKAAVNWTKKEISQDNREYLKTFKMVYREKNFVCVHSAMIEPHKFPYILDELDARENFRCFREKLCFIGHSHRQETYVLKNGRISRSGEKAIKLEENCRYICNVGSAGQPRDGDPRLCLSLYDSSRGVITFERLNYDIKEAADRILKQGLPEILALRLYKGL